MTIKINLEENKEKIFREKAMKKYGYKKGALSKALAEAIDIWLSLEEQDLPTIENPTSQLEGLLEECQETSVELQHLGNKLFTLK